MIREYGGWVWRRLLATMLMTRLVGAAFIAALVVIGVVVPTGGGKGHISLTAGGPTAPGSATTLPSAPGESITTTTRATSPSPQALGAGQPSKPGVAVPSSAPVSTGAARSTASVVRSSSGQAPPTTAARAAKPPTTTSTTSTTAPNGGWTPGTGVVGPPPGSGSGSGGGSGQTSFTGYQVVAGTGSGSLYCPTGISLGRAGQRGQAGAAGGGTGGSGGAAGNP
ncbi:MAG: hypothetical protein ACYCZV_14125, partial [Acidimicrobiales bacterium]